MNTGPDHDTTRNDASGSDFDARLRDVHAQSLDRVSTRTLVQLRPRREQARPAVAKPRLHAWPLAATCAIALVAGGLYLRHPGQQAPKAPATVATATNNDNNNEAGDDVYAALDESPELYVWLASNDTDNLVMEQIP